MTDRDEPDRPAGRWMTARRSFAAVGTIAGTALVGLVVADVYGSLTDDRPDSPLTVVAEGATDCPGGAYVLPSSVMEELPPWDEVDSDWARDNGGFDDGPTYYITIQGSSSESVILQGLRVVELQEAAAPVEPVGLSKCFGGGDLFPRRFMVDLDAPTPQVVAVDGDADIPGDGADAAVEFPYTVSVSDPEVFWVNVENSECFCTFALELRWTSGGETGVTRVALSDGPFAVAPFAATVTARFGYAADGEVVSRD